MGAVAVGVRDDRVDEGALGEVAGELVGRVAEEANGVVGGRERLGDRHGFAGRLGGDEEDGGVGEVEAAGEGGDGEEALEPGAAEARSLAAVEDGDDGRRRGEGGAVALEGLSGGRHGADGVRYELPAVEVVARGWARFFFFSLDRYGVQCGAGWRGAWRGG